MPTNKLRLLCYKLSISTKFEIIITVIIILNTIILAIRFYPMSSSYSNALEWMNVIFGIFYNIEAIIKINAIGKNYFNTSWNK